LEKELRKAENKPTKKPILKKSDLAYKPSAMSKLIDKAPESIEVESEALLPTPEQQIEYVIPKATGPK
jgi:hypothetical protein